MYIVFWITKLRRGRRFATLKLSFKLGFKLRFRRRMW